MFRIFGGNKLKNSDTYEFVVQGDRDYTIDALLEVMKSKLSPKSNFYLDNNFLRYKTNEDIFVRITLEDTLVPKTKKLFFEDRGVGRQMINKLAHFLEDD